MSQLHLGRKNHRAYMQMAGVVDLPSIPLRLAMSTMDFSCNLVVLNSWSN